MLFHRPWGGVLDRISGNNPENIFCHNSTSGKDVEVKLLVGIVRRLFNGVVGKTALLILIGLTISLDIGFPTQVEAANLTNSGNIAGNWEGTSDPDIMTNEKTGTVGSSIIATSNIFDGSSGGGNQINNYGTVVGAICGSSNSGPNASGGSNIINNTGEVGEVVFGSYNQGDNSSGGNNTVTNQSGGVVQKAMLGSYNLGNHSSSNVGNTLTNSGEVLIMMGSSNEGDHSSGGAHTVTNNKDAFVMWGSDNHGDSSTGGSNTITNNGSVFVEVVGSGNSGKDSVGGSNTIINNGLVGEVIAGSLNSGEGAKGGNNIIRNYGKVVFFDIYGTYNDAAGTSGGSNTIYNYGYVEGYITGTYNDIGGGSGGSNIIYNYGTVGVNIEGTANDVATGRGGDNTIYNYGKVGGSIYGTRNMVAGSSSGGMGNTIYNDGTVSGGIFAGDADDTVHILKNSSVVGVVDGADGTDKLYYGAAGTITSDAYKAKYLNFESLGLEIRGNSTFIGQWNCDLGMNVYNGGSLTINGEVTSSNLNNSGTTTFSGNAVINKEIINKGTLTVSSGGKLNAASLNNSGTTKIQGDSTVTGEVDNSGTLTVEKGGKLNASSLNNSGTTNIQGDSTFIGEVANSGSVMVSTSGTLNAASLSNSGTTNIAGEATLIGAVTNKGALTVVKGGKLNAASLSNSGTTSISGEAKVTGSVNNSGSLSVKGKLSAGSLSNSGWANITGALYAGSLSNTGNTYISGKAVIRGNTTNFGMLNVNGTLTSARLSNSGTLSGTGTIYSDITNTGTISPGNSMGTLNVVGSVFFDPGSFLQAEIAANGLCDSVSSSGTVTINGGTISTYLPRALYTDGFSWKIITADGGVNGKFTAIGGQPDSKVLSLSQANNGNSLGLEVDRKSYRSFAQGGAAHTGKGLDALVPLATGDMENLLVAMDFDFNEQEIARTLNELSPEMYTAFSAASLKAGALFDGTMSRRLEDLSLRRFFGLSESRAGELAQLAAQEALPLGQVDNRSASGWSMWGRAMGLWADQKESDGYLGRDQTTGGAALGADYVVNDWIVLGLATGASRTDLSWSRDNYDGDIDAVHYGFYIQGEFQGFITRLLGSYTHLSNSATRHVSFKDFSADAKGNFGADLYSAGMAIAYQTRFGAWLMKPLAEFSYQRLNEKSFSESGAGYLDLDVADRKTDSMLFNLGVKASRLIQVKGFEILPRLGLFWQHQLGDERPSLDANFTGYGTAPFTVHGAKFIKDACVAELGFTAALDSSLKFFADYRLAFADGYSDQTLSAGVMYSF